MSDQDYPVLILDGSDEHATSLVHELHESEIDATAFQAKQQFLAYLARQPVNLAILVLHSKSWWQDELRIFCDSIRYVRNEPELEIFCILTWTPRNAEEEVMNRLVGDSFRADVRHE